MVMHCRKCHAQQLCLIKTTTRRTRLRRHSISIYCWILIFFLFILILRPMVSVACFEYSFRLFDVICYIADKSQIVKSFCIHGIILNVNLRAAPRKLRGTLTNASPDFKFVGIIIDNRFVLDLEQLVVQPYWRPVRSPWILLLRICGNRCTFLLLSDNHSVTWSKPLDKSLVWFLCDVWLQKRYSIC